jgi:hypothetical protein
LFTLVLLGQWRVAVRILRIIRFVSPAEIAIWPSPGENLGAKNEDGDAQGEIGDDGDEDGERVEDVWSREEEVGDEL